MSTSCKSALALRAAFVALVLGGGLCDSAGAEDGAALELAGQAARERSDPQAAAITELGWVTANGQVLKPKRDNDAVELYRRRIGRRLRRIYASDEPLDRIGMLASHRMWTDVLPLAGEQSAAISKLDRLVREARDLRWQADADVPADDIETYDEYLQRSSQRHSDSIDHAQRMVMTGLLTEPQAALVWQQWMTSRWSKLSQTLYDDQVRDRLELSAEQLREIEHIGKFYRDEFVSRSMWDVLTEKQREQLSQMRAERPPLTEAPELPSLEALATMGATVDLAELSPVFRELTLPRGTPFEAAKNGAVVRLTGYQRRLAADLADVTRLGWMWIGQRKADAKEGNPNGDATAAAPEVVETARREFLHAAERVVLLSILSEEQAKELTAAVAGR